MGKSLAELTAEIRENNISHGWRPAEGGPGDNTFGDYLALLHSEVSEALEAYRDHKLADATFNQDWHGDPRVTPVKPEGVGSELADVLIRLLDMCDVFGINLREMPVHDCDASGMESFGDHLAWLHYLIANMIETEDDGGSADYRASEVLQAVRVVADRSGIDLSAEVDRKIAYNRTREFRHGGRHL
jgi:NTP pyrophosphatase (non-canonical NTP hydrolase)